MESLVPNITINTEIGMDMQIHPATKHKSNIEIESRKGIGAHSDETKEMIISR
jgi:hypothetical protein